MNKTILIFVSMLLLSLSSCLDEKEVGCPGELRLTFQVGDSGEEYDKVIANDIYLYIYQDKKMVWEEIIPYDVIRGNGEYRMRKVMTGNVDVVAWTVPQNGGDIEFIPDTKSSGNLNEVALSLFLDETAGYYKPISDVYVGYVVFREDITQNSSHTISVNNSVCNVNISITDNLGVLEEIPENDLVVAIEGSKAGMNVERKGTGEDAVVKAPVITSRSHTYVADRIGLLPSAEDQSLTLFIANKNERIYKIETGLQSIPGSEITIDVVLGAYADIYIDGWRIKNVEIQEM